VAAAAAGWFRARAAGARPRGPPPPASPRPLARESRRLFAALAPARLLFSHFGPVADVAATLERSAEELNVWVAETRRARDAGLDLDHAVAMVRDRTRERYAVLRPDAAPDLTAKAETVSSTRASVEGILGWREKPGPAAGWAAAPGHRRPARPAPQEPGRRRGPPRPLALNPARSPAPRPARRGLR